MHHLRYSVLLLLASVAMAQQVQYNFDQDADFSQYKTFRWEAHPESMEVDSLTKSQLGQAFNAELAKRGLEMAQSADSDLVLVYQIAVREEQEITYFDTGWAYGPGWRRGWWGPGGRMMTKATNTFDVGSIALDMYDASSKRLVWRGVVSQAIRERTNPNRRLKDMANAAQKLLKNYPPKVKK